MESLTKENFWNAIKEQYPFEMEVFGKWIDNYKKHVNWHRLFHLDNPNAFQGGPSNFTRKYHELPIAMQIGIFIQFVMETKGVHEFTPYCNSMDEWADDIKSWFGKMKESEIGKYIEPIVEGEKVFSGIRESVDGLDEMTKAMHGNEE